MFVGTSKEKFYYHNTLLCLVRAMEGKNITVDLRNDDSYVCGHVDSVDGYMNISFSNAVYCDPQGNEYLFENLFLQARNIRYVHVPETTSILSTIQTELGGNKKPRPDKKDVNTSRKVKKALKQHMETVASLRMNEDLPDCFLPTRTGPAWWITTHSLLLRGGLCPCSRDIISWLCLITLLDTLHFKYAYFAPHIT